MCVGGGGARFHRVVYISLLSIEFVAGSVGLDLSSMVMWSGFSYWCWCGFGRRRRGGEGASQSSFDGCFFVDFGFPLSVFVDFGSRLGLGLESLPSFSGLSSVVGGGLLGCAMGGRCTGMLSFVGGLTSVSFYWFPSSASMTKPSVCFLGSSVFFSSMVMPNPFPTTHLVEGVSEL